MLKQVETRGSGVWVLRQVKTGRPSGSSVNSGSNSLTLHDNLLPRHEVMRGLSRIKHVLCCLCLSPLLSRIYHGLCIHWTCKTLVRRTCSP